MFGDTDMGKQIYLTYRNLSRFASHDGDLRQVNGVPVARGSSRHDYRWTKMAEPSHSFYLASLTVMCTVAYLDALGDGDGISSLLAMAGAAGLVTTLADD